MIGLLNKLSANTKTLCVDALGCGVGFFVFEQNEFKYVFDIMDGFISYFGIMSSVSFAILTVLMQRFDGMSQRLNKASDIKKEATKVSREMNVEMFRILFMLLPVLAYFLMSFFDEQNRFGAALLSSTTFVAIVFSIFLPFKYVNFMKSHLINVVEERESEETNRIKEYTNEFLEKITSDK